MVLVVWVWRLVVDVDKREVLVLKWSVVLVYS